MKKLLCLSFLVLALSGCTMDIIDRTNPINNAIYHYKKGNFDRSREIYEQLWASGDRDTWISRHLGHIYEEGLGNTVRNKERAFELYSNGADHGQHFSMLGLYRLYKEDGDERMANYWLDILARKNNQEAIAILQREGRPIPSPDLKTY